MYFPYLRGKQFELLALRELCPLMSGKFRDISPIIEPVKNTTGLIKCFDELRKSDINFNVIINPLVGDLVGKTQEILSNLSHKLMGYSNFQIAIVVAESTDFEQIIEDVKIAGIQHRRFSFIHNVMNDKIADVQQKFQDFGPIINNVVNQQKTGSRYHRIFEAKTRVSLYDYFGSRPKNSDYLSQEDSHFSDEYKFYKEEGYRGFGDFLTIGDIYSDSGRLPWAVAIHISYADEQNRIRVKHFVSDSNDDNSDTAGKFAEANQKLVTWCDQKKIDTVAVNNFRVLHQTGHYPGLGTVKKLSIMNHIELMLTLI